MKFEVNAHLGYTTYDPTTLIFNIHALRTQHQTVLQESVEIDPYFKVEELSSVNAENRITRLEIPEPCTISVKYTATVDNHFTTVDFTNAEEISVAKLETSVFQYLYPSRYCQSDKLFRFADSKFGKIINPFEKVYALTDWIYNNVEYLSGSTNSQTSAYDTVTEQAGVCRDFAHLGIALCRALNIPARYFTGYAHQLFPPDFHACFEAYMGGQWILFDATRLAPLNGLVKIATGRDAADTAVATIFGKVECNLISVRCDCLEDNFVPLFYQPGNFTGVTYE